MVEFVDVFPTLCELCEVPVPDDLEGVSVKPLLTAPERPWKTAVFSQYLREGGWVGLDGQEYHGRAIRTDRFRYVEWTPRESEEVVARELYDHHLDPEERVNVAERPESVEVVETLRRQLHEGWTAALPEAVGER